MTHRGTLSEIIFRNEDNGYTVALFETQRDIFMIVGHLPGVGLGEHLEIAGEEKEHPRYGLQFVVESFSAVLPRDEEGLVSFLSSGQFPRIGETMARRIVEMFGEETLERIEENPNILLRVEGIGKKTLEGFLLAYEEIREKREDILLLTKLGLPSSLISPVLRELGPGAGQRVARNPYLLYGKFPRLRFASIDEMALGSGMDPLDPRRIRAFLQYFLHQALGEGHCALPAQALLSRMRERGFEDESVLGQLQELKITGTLFEEGGLYYLRSTYRAQSRSAAHLFRLLREGAGKQSFRKSALRFQSKTGVELGEDQWQALEQIFTQPLSIVSGGPGTGKTTLVRCMVDVLSEAGLSLELAAPTGRAAKRMEEATGWQARTIHRLLEFQFGEEEQLSFARNEENPLECDVLIIDEFSMVDIFLLSSLLEAIPSGARVVFIGDKDQLPSVGAGNVLADLLAAEPIATIYLQRIYRQRAQSLIPFNARKILDGDPQLLQDPQGDFFFLRKEGVQPILKTLKELMSERLSGFSGLDAQRDIQVLTPMRKGPLGSSALNTYLQEFLNPAAPHKSELRLSDRLFREGDKLMQVKNNYLLEWVDTQTNQPGKGVFNGEIGELVKATRTELTILFDGTRVCRYPTDKLLELELAYAMTIHKSQGSEFPCALLVLGWAAPALLSRNVLYTGVTRGKRLVVLLGERRVLGAMVASKDTSLRISGLTDALEELYSRSADKEELR